MLPHGEVMVVFTDNVKYKLCHPLYFLVEIQSISDVKRISQLFLLGTIIRTSITCIWLALKFI